LFFVEKLIYRKLIIVYDVRLIVLELTLLSKGMRLDMFSGRSFAHVSVCGIWIKLLTLHCGALIWEINLFLLILTVLNIYLLSSFNVVQTIRQSLNTSHLYSGKVDQVDKIGNLLIWYYKCSINWCYLFIYNVRKIKMLKVTVLIIIFLLSSTL
jgi:hypothetical protein